MRPSLDRASTWLRPDQIERLRTACYDDCFQPPLEQRNDALITLLYDTGLRVGELVQLTVDHLDLDTGSVRTPAADQHERRQKAPQSPEILAFDPAHNDRKAETRDFRRGRKPTTGKTPRSIADRLPPTGPNYYKYNRLHMKYRWWKTHALAPFPSNSM